MSTKCFLLTPTDRIRRSLRVYSERVCTVRSEQICVARVILDDVPKGLVGSIEDFKDDPRWPAACENCKAEFPEDSTQQLFTQTIYVDENDQKFTLNEAPAGAMWYADWLNNWHAGPDGRCLMVRTPGGDWCIDSRANNCGLPDDNVHRCWIRHGVPPKITVDKNGLTCNAGQGSIQSGDYHGFLQDGYLT